MGLFNFEISFPVCLYYFSWILLSELWTTVGLQTWLYCPAPLSTCNPWERFFSGQEYPYNCKVIFCPNSCGPYFIWFSEQCTVDFWDPPHPTKSTGKLNHRIEFWGLIQSSKSLPKSLQNSTAFASPNHWQISKCTTVSFLNQCAQQIQILARKRMCCAQTFVIHQQIQC